MVRELELWGCGGRAFQGQGLGAKTFRKGCACGYEEPARRPVRLETQSARGREERGAFCSGRDNYVSVCMALGFRKSYFLRFHLFKNLHWLFKPRFINTFN